MTSKITSIKLTNKFINGLKNYGLTYDDIKNSNWRYCGGNKGRHFNYFKLCFKDDEIPELIDKCVCGQCILENCYITDGERILVLGNCCIKKFIPKSSRTCEICGEPHKNRKVNKCNNCRIGICEICNKECDPKYKKCYNCEFNIKDDYKISKCVVCDIECNSEYRKCYNCAFNIKNNYKIGKCITCDKECNPIYKKCYKCAFK